ncbi:type III PLP-dependent enzyme [Hirschia litorea]|uniref:ornithine decarboxylase n=1 Tax=Hirschia litorea TaxID=1199156 RepID=A0ABW2IPZ2_9PROT
MSVPQTVSKPDITADKPSVVSKTASAIKASNAGFGHGVIKTSTSRALQQFIANYTGPTPHLVVELDIVERNYKALKNALPQAHHHYAIKANPHPDLLKRLQHLGCFFECASIQEIDMCLAAGAQAKDILYGNPLKKASEIKAAFERGIEQFVFDAALELDKIITHAPGAKVVCRITTDGSGAISPLSIKFGCPPDKAIEWLIKANDNGLIPHGISFHTGSQQLNPKSWDAPIHAAASIFDALADRGISSMSVLDVGGGFPTNYRKVVPPIDTFCDAIAHYVDTYFKDKKKPLIYTEPGRYLPADAGFILAEVVLVAPSHTNPDIRWVYLDIGRYGGLVETQIDYPVYTHHEGPTGPVIMAGQTCDSNDVIYAEEFRYHLPNALAPGDRVILAHTGVYTTTYSTTLNGFPNLTSECI